MDFFDRQARAQSNTRWLIVYFLLAIVGIIATLELVFSIAFNRPYLDPEMLLWVSGGVIGVVLIGSLTKIAELAQGGRVVAAMLGGEAVAQNTSDLNERKLLNIVEEMSLASGVPVPEIYILPDRSINAFAAGHGPGDTAIGVTRGCIEQLSRDELQGVIAHEFSHILHGDMKLNIRLMGLLNGILCLALIGGFLMRVTVYSDAGSSRRDGKNGGGVVLAVIAISVALYLIGWIGVFFGNLIKAAVSRQREFLADASAVQFTRNPSGIASALWKIGRHHSRLSSPRAAEASHLYFGNGVRDPLLSLFATHPPIDERIKAIDANFDPAAVDVSTPPPLPAEVPKGDTPALERARQLLMALPGFAGESVRELHGACAFVYALLLDEDADIRRIQLNGLKVDDAMHAETLMLFDRRKEISLEQRLPLVDLVIPTLRQLSPGQYAEFRDNVKHLVESDRQIKLFEYALQKTILRHLELFFTRSTGAGVKYKALGPILPDVCVLLSGLAWIGHSSAPERDAAYAAGVRELLIASARDVPRLDACDLAKIDSALDRVALAAPDVKRTVLTACRETIAHDGVVAVEEYELLRAIADTLDCPMPPLPQQPA